MGGGGPIVESVWACKVPTERMTSTVKILFKIQVFTMPKNTILKTTLIRLLLFGKVKILNGRFHPETPDHAYQEAGYHEQRTQPKQVNEGKFIGLQSKVLGDGV